MSEKRLPRLLHDQTDETFPVVSKKSWLAKLDEISLLCLKSTKIAYVRADEIPCLFLHLRMTHYTRPRCQTWSSVDASSMSQRRANAAREYQTKRTDNNDCVYDDNTEDPGDQAKPRKGKHVRIAERRRSSLTGSLPDMPKTIQDDVTGRRKNQNGGWMIEREALPVGSEAFEAAMKHADNEDSTESSSDESEMASDDEHVELKAKIPDSRNNVKNKFRSKAAVVICSRRLLAPFPHYMPKYGGNSATDTRGGVGHENGCESPRGSGKNEEVGNISANRPSPKTRTRKISESALPDSMSKHRTLPAEDARPRTSSFGSKLRRGKAV